MKFINDLLYYFLIAFISVLLVDTLKLVIFGISK
jgi:hypothetical protein